MPGRWPGGILLTVVGSILAAGIAAFLLLGTLSARKASLVRLGWDETLGPSEQIRSRFPSTEANDDALELERLAAAIGVELAPRAFPERDRPTGERVARLRRFRRDSAAWLRRQLGTERRGVEAVPEAAARFLEDHRQALSAIRRHLQVSSPRWELQIERKWAAPLPNLIGHLDLQRLLIADALVRILADDRAIAGDDLLAAWRLNRALRDRPTVVTQLVAISAARMQLGGLRQLPDPPAAWRERLAEHDFRETLLTALGMQGRLWTQLEDPTVVADLSAVPDRFVKTVVRPYYEYCLAQASDEFRLRLTRAAQVGAICDRDLTRLGVDLAPRLPPWNVVAELFAPDFSDTLYRLARLELDLELTDRLLVLQDLRRAAGGRWPEAPAIATASRACPGDRWIYEQQADGVTIALDREPSWPETRAPIAPTRFRLE